MSNILIAAMRGSGGIRRCFVVGHSQQQQHHHCRKYRFTSSSSSFSSSCSSSLETTNISQNKIFRPNLYGNIHRRMSSLGQQYHSCSSTQSSSMFLSKLKNLVECKHNTILSTTLRHYAASKIVLRENNNDEDDDSSLLPEREVMPFDVLIVGGGPAGLSAGIRIKQLCIDHNYDLSVCIIDKGSEIGSHILSGNVFDPKAIHELFPEQSDPTADNHWTKEFYEIQGSYATPVAEDSFKILAKSGSSYTIPNILLPSQLHNHGNYIISLSQLCRYLAKKAEELGVEIYPGFAASEVLVEENAVRGVATRDVGIAKDGITYKSTYERGVELRARQTLFAEGARGSCSEYIMKQFQLRSDPSVQPQTYGLGFKEVWQIPPEQLKAGYVQHTIGYPLQSSITDKVFGGSFLYHQEPDLVLIGVVIGLDYQNPYINPYLEFQKWKTHPEISKHLQGGTCISYGARVLNEGGFHSIPKVTFPGGALLGCSAGFLNAVKIKGSHTAIKSGMLAAEATFDAFKNSDVPPVAETGEIPSEAASIEITNYAKSLKDSWIYKELYEVRNSHAAFSKWGMGGGLLYTGFTTHISKGKEPWTLHSHTNDKLDCDYTGKAKEYKPITYPPADGKLTFDLLTNLQRSGTYHADDQPIHLRIKPEKADIPKNVSYQIYAGPESRFCPAGVYEYVDDDENDIGNKKLVINSQNCIHCKCCSIKTPQEYIEWTVPEGGGGPQYQIM